MPSSSRSTPSTLLPDHRRRGALRRTFVVLNGGLGNQLFQLAAAASVRGLEAVRVRNRRPTHQLDLEDLIPGLLQDWDRMDRWRLGFPFDSATGWRRIVEIALKPIRMIVSRRTLHIHTGIEGAFAPPPLRPKRPLVLDGYFQHPDWYEGAFPSLVDSLLAAAPSPQPVDDSDLAAATVLHVRGGDYQPAGWRLDVGYYERALDLLGVPGAVHIITDDPAAGGEVAAMCARRGWECTMGSPDANAIDDFWTLAAARRLVMSNSTFCWWAAHVGNARWGPGSSDRVVVFPENWLLGSGGQLRHDNWVGLR